MQWGVWVSHTPVAIATIVTGLCVIFEMGAQPVGTVWHQVYNAK